MIRLRKLPPPAVLIANATAWTLEYLALVAGMAGVPAAARHRYRHPEVKYTLRVETHDKCAYCESKVRHVVAGDIDHILPRAHRPELVVDWPNLTLSCPECNRLKGDYYDENAPLINPYLVDPESHILFGGPMAICQDLDAGHLTIGRLKLNRPDLLQRREETLDRINKLFIQWSRQSEGSTKDLLAEELADMASAEAEHSAAVRDFLRLRGFNPSQATPTRS